MLTEKEALELQARVETDLMGDAAVEVIESCIGDPLSSSMFVLEALGNLIALGREAEGLKAIGDVETFKTVAQVELNLLTGGDLRSMLTSILIRVTKRIPWTVESRRDVEEMLRHRTRHELARIAVEALGLQLSADHESEMDAFDDLITQEAAALGKILQTRADANMWADPAYRGRLW